MKHNTRKTAARIIAAWLENPKEFPDRLIQRVTNDRAFVTELVYGVTRRRRTLEWVIGEFVKKPPKPYPAALLMVGAYQLLFTEVEVYAAVNETVEAAPKPAAGLINAVLRRIDRERESILQRLDRQKPGIRFSFPDDLLNRWTRCFGKVQALKLCELCNTPPETFVRLDTNRCPPADFQTACKENGIELQPDRTAHKLCYFKLPRGTAVPDVPGYTEGWFTVQDPATAAAVELLNPQPGESVLDACAAPGGKSAAIASLMNGKGKLVAMDLHEDRLALLRQTIERTGYDFIELRQGDATAAPEQAGEFDAILLDVPCMNTGVLRRRADARWRFDETRMKKLSETQLSILDSAALRLKPAGRLVYSTCSLEQEENEKLISHWLEKHPDFELTGSVKNLPFRSGTDGSYAALLRRKSIE